MSREQSALAPQSVQPTDPSAQGVSLAPATGEKPQLALEQKSEAMIRVEIYVAEHCLICEYAYEIAEVIQEKFPDVDLRIINLSLTTEPIPDAVFATPTYLLNGRLWSLGNPSREDIQARLSPESQ